MRAIALPLAVMLLAGCVIKNEAAPPAPPPEQPGDINLFWSFDGKKCLETPDVVKVHVMIQGQILENGGYFPCNAAGIDGIRLKDFDPGSYNVVVDGVDAGEKTIYTASSSVHVNGTITQSMNLVRVGGKEKLQAFWKFGKAKWTCAQAGISEVIVQLGQATPVSRPCTDVDPVTHAPVEGVAISNLDAASYDLRLSGIVLDPVTHEKQVWFWGKFALPVIAGKQNDFTVVLDDVWASATFIPKFSDVADCTAAGAQTIWIRLTNGQGQYYGNPAGYSFECGKSLTNGLVWDYLPAGDVFDNAAGVYTATYRVELEAWDNPYQGHVVKYGTPANSPAVVSLYAGSDNKQTITMLRR